MDELISFLTSMIALSVGVERVVEIIKGLVPWLRSDPENAKWVPWRRLALQVIAALAGTATVGVIGPSHFLPKVVSLDGTTVHLAGVAALLGLMASGGSAFWNHALDVAGAMKTVRERAATARTA